jgi:peptide/nickel transport system permease protein
MKRFLVYLKSRPLGMASVIALVIIYAAMVFAEAIAPYGAEASFPDYACHPPNARLADIHLFAKGEPYRLWGIIPMERHLFTTAGGDPVFLMGADSMGRDLFSRIIHGSRISLTIGFIAAAISLVFAILFGGLAGYFGGKTDWAVMRLAEFLLLIPGLYLILFLSSLLSARMDTGRSYMMITLILSLAGWPGAVRTLRGMTRTIKREEFIRNARLEMIPSPVIIFRYIIPQTAGFIFVGIALSVPAFMMAETALSYLGMGIADPAVSWGSLLRRDISTIANLRAYPWFLCPVWFLSGVTLAFNFLGDALRDYFDPHHTVFRKKGIGTRDQGLGTSVIVPAPGVKTTRDASKQQSPFPTPHSPLPTPHIGLLGKVESAAAGLLEVKDLRVTFSVLRGTKTVPVEAVRGVSFSLGKGEILGITGESGGGKSITACAIPGLLPHNAEAAGSILYEGKEITALRTKELRAYRGKKIGMIFEEPRHSYDPLQNIGKAFIETFRNGDPAISKAIAIKKAVALLDEAGLPNGRELLSNFPHQFPGGQLQRIGIALAIAQGCELLIADEPTTAMDAVIQRQIVDLLKTLRRTRRISIIFISHDIDLVAGISDRMLVMYGGLLMEAAATRDILSGAAHPYTKALLAASPRFGSHYDTNRLKIIPGKVADLANPESGCPFAPRCAEIGDECQWATPPMVELETVGIRSGRSFRCVKKGDRP